MAEQQQASQSTQTSTSSEVSDTALLAALISTSAVEAVLKRHTAYSSFSIDPKALSGAYNVVFVGTALPNGPRFVVRIPTAHDFDRVRFEADAFIMRRVRERTCIPIPEVFGMSVETTVTPDNPIGQPYLVLSFIAGVSLHDLWFKRDRLDDDARLRVLEQIACFHYQLSPFQYDRLGNLIVDLATNELVVGPFRDLDQPGPKEVFQGGVARKGPYAVKTHGPYDTVRQYHQSRLDELEATATTDWNRSNIMALRMCTAVLPDPALDGPPFVMRFPDFNAHNILVDPDTLEITGFIDWDHISSLNPREMGYGMYPAWLTIDWDPIMYGWRPPAGSSSDSSGKSDNGIDADDSRTSNEMIDYDSPDTISSHRRLYCLAMSGVDADLTQKVTRLSHIAHALDLALTKELCRNSIIPLLLGHIFSTDWLDRNDMLIAIEQGNHFAERVAQRQRAERREEGQD